MADQSKEKSPPPLLLMPASGGLSFDTSSNGSLLMPVVQTDASIFSPEEEGEVDSFIGQDSFVGQDTVQVSSNSSFQPYFQSPLHASTSGSSDPFSLVSQPDSKASSTSVTSESQFAPTFRSQSEPVVAGLSPSPGPPLVGGLSTGTAAQKPANSYRMAGGRPKYAQPAPGTYAPGPDLGQTIQPPAALPNFGPPPSSVGMSMPSQGPVPGGPPNVAPPPPTVQEVPSPSSDFVGTVSPPQATHGPYIPVQPHWFYCKNIELRQIWKPFTLVDSLKLEDTFRGAQEDLLISTDGGRYDVDLQQRTRHAVYWEENPSQVKRCSWFYKPDGDNRFVPYEEDFAEKLEQEYKNAIINNIWHKKLEFPTGETIVMHNPHVIVQFGASAPPDQWGTTQGDQLRPRVVKRGVDDFDEIGEGEPAQVDHLVFVVHGIGSTCDLRFRNIVECVDDFRSISHQMLQSHFKDYQDEGRIGRVEFLPVRWHGALHGDATGIDRKLKNITLQSIGKLRNYTNDTLLDILMYASPTYCQTIADTVGSEINRLYSLYLERNPEYNGMASVAGHSLGSLIMFDLLSHQEDSSFKQEADLTPQSGNPPPTQPFAPESKIEPTPQLESVPDTTNEDKEEESTIEDLLGKLGLGDFVATFKKEQIDMETLSMCEDSDIKEMGLPMGPRKKLMGYLKELKQKQQRKLEERERKNKQEAERRIQEEVEKRAKEQSQQNTEKSASRHPLLRAASSSSVSYVFSHKGIGTPFVKYPQLDFSPSNFFALGSPIAMYVTVRGTDMLGEEFRLPTCPGFFNIFHPFDPVAYRIEPLITHQPPPKPFLMPHHKGRKRLHLELKDSLARVGTDLKQKIIASVKTTWKTINDFAMAHRTTPQEIENEVDNVVSEMTQQDDITETESITSSMQEDDILLGHLNQGRRLDYVLQEKPIESFNDYLFALGSHACYWESEDTVLMILKEIYALQGIAPRKPGQDPLASRYRPAYSSPPMMQTSPTNISPTGSAMRVGEHGGMNPPTTAGLMTQPPMTGVGMGGQGVPPPPMAGFVRR